MVDFWIGRLLAKLDALGLRENTLVFFTSDHGFYFGEHGYFGKAEWVHEPEAAVSEDSSLPGWLAESWLLTVDTGTRGAGRHADDDDRRAVRRRPGG